MESYRRIYVYIYVCTNLGNFIYTRWIISLFGEDSSIFDFLLLQRKRFILFILFLLFFFFFWENIFDDIYMNKEKKWVFSSD